jgi:hypothetical protein
MTERAVRTRRDGPVLYVRLNRPGQLNAFDWAMRDELAALWAVTAADKRVRPDQFVPLRHRRPGDGAELLTRIGYAPYAFTCADGASASWRCSTR